MNKNLEIEYKNMIRAEVPDIWDKIEAKIDEQEAKNAGNEKNIIKAADIVNVQDTDVTYGVQKNVIPFKKRSRWKYFVFPAAAALLCVAIAIPVLRNAGGSNTAGPTAAANSFTGAAESAVMSDTAEPQEACESEAEYYDNKYKDAGNRGEDFSAQGVVNSLAGDNNAEFFFGGSNGMAAAQSYMTDEAMGEECEDDIDEETVFYEGVFTIVISEDVKPEDKKILAEEIAEAAGLVLSEDDSKADAEEGQFVLKSVNSLNESQIAEIIMRLGSYSYIKDVSFEQSIR